MFILVQLSLVFIVCLTMVKREKSSLIALLFMQHDFNAGEGWSYCHY